jgi:molybdopterin molybdotransferase
MISVDEARGRIADAVQPLDTEVVGLTDALGRVLARGYAVRAADVTTVPVTLTCVGEVPAGQQFGREISVGEAVRIFTGAPLPAGADAIVIQEDTEQTGDTVTIREAVTPGTYVRPAGLDFAAGDSLLKGGTTLTPRKIGLAAAMNVPWLTVRRRPRIAILATGDEIVMPGDPRTETQIVSSNGWALAAFVTANGGVPTNMGIAPDNAEALKAMAGAAAGADLIVTTGGASVGKHDLIRSALGDIGLELDFWRIAMRPGKPLLFGRLGETPMLGLPGNPVSSMVCALIFLAPLMDALLGRAMPDATVPAQLGASLDANDQRQDYLRAGLSRQVGTMPIATPFDRQDSSMLSLLAHSECLIVRPPMDPPRPAGDTVSVLPLDLDRPLV